MWSIVGVAYAPHEGRPIEEKEDFYKQIDHRCWKIAKKKELLCIGDFNVRWHARRENEHDVLGPFTVGRGNDFMEKEESKLIQATNREYCMDWCQSNDLVHSNSWFEKDIDKKISKDNIESEKQKSLLTNKDKLIEETRVSINCLLYTSDAADE